MKKSKKYIVRVAVGSAFLQKINKWLTTNNPAEYQNEDETVSVTAKFSDGCEMDIKCCGCQDDSSWTEAVLFNAQGHELCCTEPADEFTGEWELEYCDTRYIAIVTEN